MYFTDTHELRKFEREMRRSLILTGAIITVTTKNLTQTEKMTEVDFMTIKIRSPTNGYCLNLN